MDRILIEELRARCIIGLDEDERRERRDVVISVALSVELRRLPADERQPPVDYRAVKKRLLAEVENSDHRLLEALAEHVARICLQEPAVARVQVRVEKPGALRFARTVAVELEREQSHPRGGD